jgi:cellulose synthase/poly-beta-1,6-N-acetylglucosamine synthase-like glycosyltransferase
MEDLLLSVLVYGLALGLGLVAAGVLLSCSMLLVEVIAASLGQVVSHSPEPPLDESMFLAVLVPAHNEAVGISSTLESIARDLRPQDKILVVADDCTDDTALIAKANGAMVVERFEPTLRGKGYALDYGLKCLQADPPDVVIFVDADCDVEPGSLPRLAHQALAQNRPIQASYLIEQPTQQSLKGAISAFAIRVKNFVRPLGLQRLHAPCLLTGAGIALPWQAATAVTLASSHIVEDMKWGIDLALNGHLPIFYPEARVISRLPDEDPAAKKQRTRWEHGHLQVLTSYTPTLLWQGLRQRNFSLLALALELSVLPLSLLVMVWSGVTAAALSLMALGGPVWPLGIAILAGIGLLSAIFLAWVRYGQSILSLTQLVMVPIYILWKIPLYIRFALKPEKQWVRTQRTQQDISESGNVPRT